ncbi:MAG: hypothetical protein LBG23_05890 [Endomicrobium sp.]|nr:hypothetical protein [Endomicrobium sp.]
MSGGAVNVGDSSTLVLNNRVRIEGSKVEGSVDGDIVELKGSPNFGKNTLILGSTLNIETQDQIVVKGIADFENYNFEKVRVNGGSKIKVVGKSNEFWRVDLSKARVVGKVEGEVKKETE